MYPQTSTIDVNDIIISTLQMIEPLWRQGLISSSSALGGRGTRQLISEEEATRESAKGPRSLLEVSLGPAGYVSAHPVELRSVLTNLISNAVDALPPEHGRIETSSGQEGHWAIIRVSDNGTGIPPEIRERIFEPYFTTKGERGSGLGLNNSQSIIARYGGMLEVETEEGNGSIFTIFLPLTTPPEHRP